MDGRVITKLSIQKGNPGRVNVYLDGKFAFGIPKYAAAGLKTGQELTESEIEKLQERDQKDRALSSALRSLNRRLQSESELQKKLIQKGFSQDQIESVMERLKENHLIDDNSFSAMWVENQTAFRPRSKRMLTLELKRKGVSEENIRESLKDLDEEKAALDCGLRYMKRLQGLDRPNFQKKLSAYLARRGFGYELIDQTVRTLWADIQNSEKDSIL